MAKTSPQLEWCVVRFADDMNWWVTEISDPIRWDVDGLGIIDPRQVQHLIEVCEAYRDYGFDADVIDSAFYKFRIESEDKKTGMVRLVRVRENILESEDALFALPDILDEEKGPYADLLDQITKYRVRLLNDLIDFEQKLTIDELEEEIRDRQNAELMEGLPVHPFNELSQIMEFVPDGYELDEDDDERSDDDEELADIPDFDEEEEKLEEDDTMKWDEDEDEEEEDDELSDGFQTEGGDDDDDDDDR